MAKRRASESWFAAEAILDVNVSAARNEIPPALKGLREFSKEYGRRVRELRVVPIDAEQKTIRVVAFFRTGTPPKGVTYRTYQATRTRPFAIRVAYKVRRKKKVEN